MEDQEEILKKIYDSFQHEGKQFHVLENRVPFEQQKEYFLYSLAIRQRRRKRLNDNDYIRYEEKLENVNLSKDEKKKILTILALSSEIRAFRLLEKYLQHPDEDLTYWASMALIESRMAIETELTEEQQIYISTGLGGKNGKLRFYVLILSSQEASFVDYQRTIIEKEFRYFFPEFDCEIERLSIHDNYVELVFLIPFAANMKKMFETVIAECNLYGNFRLILFAATNIKEFNQNEINQALKFVRSKLLKRS